MSNAPSACRSRRVLGSSGRGFDDGLDEGGGAEGVYLDDLKTLEPGVEKREEEGEGLVEWMGSVVGMGDSTRGEEGRGGEGRTEDAGVFAAGDPREVGREES